MTGSKMIIMVIMISDKMIFMIIMISSKMIIMIMMISDKMIIMISGKMIIMDKIGEEEAGKRIIIQRRCISDWDYLNLNHLNHGD